MEIAPRFEIRGVHVRVCASAAISATPDEHEVAPAPLVPAMAEPETVADRDARQEVDVAEPSARTVSQATVGSIGRHCGGLIGGAARALGGTP